MAEAQGNRVKLAISPSAGTFNLRTPTEISRTSVFDLRTPTEISRTGVFDLRTSTEISRADRTSVYLSRATQERTDFVVRRLGDRRVAKAVIRVRKCIKESTIDLRAKHAASV